MKYLTTILLCLGISRNGQSQSCISSCGCPQSSIQLLQAPSCYGINRNGGCLSSNFPNLPGPVGGYCLNTPGCRSPCLQQVCSQLLLTGFPIRVIPCSRCQNIQGVSIACVPRCSCSPFLFDYLRAVPSSRARCCPSSSISAPQPICSCCPSSTIQPISICCSKSPVPPIPSCVSSCCSVPTSSCCSSSIISCCPGSFSGSCSVPSIQPVSNCCCGLSTQPLSTCCYGPLIQPVSTRCSEPAIQPVSTYCSGPSNQPDNTCCSGPSILPITTCCSGSTSQPSGSCCFETIGSCCSEPVTSTIQPISLCCSGPTVQPITPCGSGSIGPCCSSPCCSSPCCSSPCCSSPICSSNTGPINSCCCGPSAQTIYSVLTSPTGGCSCRGRQEEKENDQDCKDPKENCGKPGVFCLKCNYDGCGNVGPYDRKPTPWACDPIFNLCPCGCQFLPCQKIKCPPGGRDKEPYQEMSLKSTPAPRTKSTDTEDIKEYDTNSPHQSNKINISSANQSSRDPQKNSPIRYTNFKDTSRFTSRD